MNGIRLLASSVAMAGLALAAGCGGGVSGTASAGNGVEKSQSCITTACHDSSLWTSKVTGQSLVGEWNSSPHRMMNVGCVDCHVHTHKDQCADCHGGQQPTQPASAVDCYKCHGDETAVMPLDSKHLTSKKAFTNLTSALPLSTDSAGYAVMKGTAYASQCIWCHNPHDNALTEQLNDWADSGHGKLNATPFVKYDMKVRGTDNATPATSVATDCVRCHTSTGYINYVTSNFTDISPWGAVRNPDGTVKADNPRPAVPSRDSVIPISNQKQVIYCNVCHDPGASYGSQSAYGFKRRTVGQVTAYYNFSSAATAKLTAAKFPTKYPGLAFTFPDVATSNICMTCHTGREAGATLKAVAGEGANFANLSFINSHYLTAGATLFKASGFEFYTSAAKYRNPSYYKHDKIGVENTNGTGSDGPCVTCHLKPRRHTFVPVTKSPDVGASGTPLDGTITAIVSPICIKCHTDSSAWTTATLQAEKDGFKAALDALQNQLEVKKGIFFSNTNPYFFTSTTYTFANGFKNWGSVEVMGAAFNFNLLYHDYGAYAHNSNYTKRLIYDSIDLIDDGVLNFSVGSTLDALGQTMAKAYLLKNGTTTGTSAERR